MKHHAHVVEERLFDCYLAARNGEALSPPIAEHLADCEPCAARYADLAAFMDRLRAEGTAEADAIFTPDRLSLQHQQIARRLQQVGRAARVISFPGRFVRRTMSVSSSHAAPRWVAAAAAAGLFVGVAVGASYQFGQRRPMQPSLGAPSASALVTPAAMRGDSEAAADAAFLSELELALDRPRTRELLAFDALTPHAREMR